MIINTKKSNQFQNKEKDIINLNVDSVKKKNRSRKQQLKYLKE